jgi:hypothetical protein
MRTISIGLFAILFGVGCGPSGPVKVHPVHGKIVYAGKPAAGVQVFFLPTDAPMVPQIPASPHAVTDANGEYRLTTYAEGDGAAEGKYLVILVWPPAQKNSEHDEEADTDRLLGWYDAAHTKLTATVTAGDNAIAPFQLRQVSSPPPRSGGIPGRN